MARINTSFGSDQSAAMDASQKTKTATTQKRGRKANTDAETSRPSKRARNSTETATETEPRRSRRERNSGDGANWWQAGESSEQQASTSKKGPQGKQAKAATKATKSDKHEKAKRTAKKSKAAPEPEPPNDTPKRKAGRPRRVSTEATEPAEEAPVKTTKASERKKSKKSTKKRKISEAAEPSPAEATTSPQQKGKRRRKARQSEAEETETREAAEEEPEPEQEPEGEEAEDAGRRRRQSAGGNTDQPNQPFAQLVPRTRYIPLATMANKWAPLEREAIAAVQSLLEECARPVVARVRAGAGASGGGAAAERRQEQTRQAIAGVTRRLRSKLVKGIPFPPGTVHVPTRGRKSTRLQNDSDGNGLAADFNFERAAEGAQALEQQLGPLQHAIALLERERKREEEALAADYAALRALETNAQADLRTWRDRTKRAHVLAPVDGGDGGRIPTTTPGATAAARGDNKSNSLQYVELVGRAPASGDDQGVDKDSNENGGLFENLDKDLSTVASQLSNHMDSLKSNLQQIDGVLPAMIQSKAALQHVLFERLEPKIYEQILLGQ